MKTATNVDFSQYKQSTIRRRIARRMMVHDLKSLGAYAEFLETHPNEVAALYRDLLINFTSFFREPEMFEVLGNALARLTGGTICQGSFPNLGGGLRHRRRSVFDRNYGLRSPGSGRKGTSHPGLRDGSQ